MNIKIVCLERRTPKEFFHIEEHYRKMISKHIKIEIIKQKDFNEGNLKGFFFVCLDENGKIIDSYAFSELLFSKENILFLIGGKQGIPKNLLEKADLTISLSKMTFSHQLAKIILLEQIYRGIAIKKGLPYV